MELANKKACTGCGACAYVCPKKCISFKPDGASGISYPAIDDSLCINCGKCRTFCPALNPLEASKPMQAYAAWSSDKEERRTSASGGIAAEIYKYAIANGWMIVGAAFDEDFKVRLKLADSVEVIKEFKNSKYVFSSTDNVFQDIDKQLKAGSKIAIIALPCQIAAIKRVFYKYIDRLLLVDLVCHGTTPSYYLKQYIRYMEVKYGKNVGSITFRDPEIGTQKFALSLYDTSGKRFYSSTSYDDPYQFGYHQMVIYRENCYHCHYANGKRLSDITIGDYKGLGRSVHCSFSEEKVSCLLVNTPKGSDYISSMINKCRIVASSRPVEEPINGDCQLRHPSVKSYSRRLFEKKYKGDFVRTIGDVYTKTRIARHLLRVCKFPISVARQIFSRL